MYIISRHMPEQAEERRTKPQDIQRRGRNSNQEPPNLILERYHFTNLIGPYFPFPRFSYPWKPKASFWITLGFKLSLCLASRRENVQEKSAYISALGRRWVVSFTFCPFGEKSVRYLLKWRLVGPIAGLDAVEKRNNILPLMRTQPHFTASSSPVHPCIWTKWILIVIRLT
jgi:hypothetical protein